MRVDPGLLTPLEPACEWRSDELGSSYVLQLTADHVDELDAALRHAEERTTGILEITRELFPLPTLAPELAHITDDLINGAGVILIRGLPVERYAKDRASAIYWGVGMHLGRPWPQNVKGHLLGDVTDQGKAYDDPTSRGNEIGGLPFPFHSDGSDLVGLFCLDPGARRREPRGQRRVDPQRARARRARSPRGAVRGVPVRLSRRACPRCARLVRDACLHPSRRPPLRALHPSVH